MKKSSLFVAGAIAVVGLATGCASTNVSKVSSPVASAVKADLSAKITVGQNISGTASQTVILGRFALGAPTKFADGVFSVGTESPVANLLGNPVSSLKAAAAYNAIKGADVIVAPKYTVDIEDYFVFKKYKVDVKGKAGTITNIK